jgi:hypothetical protein
MRLYARAAFGTIFMLLRVCDFGGYADHDDP